MALPENKDLPISDESDIANKLDSLKMALFDTLIETEREDFHSDLETFDIHKDKRKTELNESLNEYFLKLKSGYEAILRVIDENDQKKNFNKGNLIKI